MIEINPLVSIIIPIFNREELIEQTLDSIKSQKYLNWECLLVDDGSKDNTINIIKDYAEKEPKFKVLIRPNSKKKGGNACRNYGFEKSKGELIQWFDSDDIMHEDKILDKVNVFKKEPELDFVVSEGIEFTDSITNTFNKWDKISSDNPLVDHIIGKVNLHTNGPLFKKSFLKNKLLFNEELQRKQEWEFYTRLLFDSVNYYPLRKTSYYFRIHQESINGFNSPKTLTSIIKANNLVFKKIKNEENFLKKHNFLRKHFLNKYFYNITLVKKSKLYKNYIPIFFGVVMVLDLNMILSFFKKK